MERFELVISPSGASGTCPVCGTIYDLHPNVGDVPPVGDGCDHCSATEDELDEFFDQSINRRENGVS